MKLGLRFSSKYLLHPLTSQKGVRPSRLMWLLILGLIFSFSVHSAEAKETRSVGLVTFTAVSIDNSVTLSWQTASELDSVGFRLYRSSGDGTFMQVDEQLIPAFGTPTTGATYEFVDIHAEGIETAVYRLTEVQINGTEIELAISPVEITQTAQPILVLIPNNPPINPEPIVQVPQPPAGNNQPATESNQPLLNQSTEPSRQNTVSIQNQPANEIVVESIERRTAVNLVSGNEPIVLFQDPTPEGGYPPPVEPTPLPEGYVPAPTPTAVEQLEGSGYVAPATAQPVPGDDPDERDLNNSVTIIGDQTALENAQAQQEAAPLPPTQGRLYLWAGFIVALLIFGIAIYATTLIFTRRSQ